MAFTKHGVLMERDPFIKGCINRAGRATVDVDGGSLLAVGSIEVGNSDIYELTFPSADTKMVAIAYNPSVKYDVIAGQKYPAQSNDDRAYFNIAGEEVDFFYPKVNIEFGVHMANIEGDTEPVEGNFLEITPDKGTYTVKATQTDGVPSFEVVEIIKQDYLDGSLNDDVEKVYIVATRYNG